MMFGQLKPRIIGAYHTPFSIGVDFREVQRYCEDVDV